MSVMSDIKLFCIEGSCVSELPAKAVSIEKSLQNLIEHHLEKLLNVRLLSSEYATGKTHGGRIDTLGLDENGCPVIIEYKRAVNENVINQGLFYLDWLQDHRAEFKLLVLERIGKDAADAIEWSSPRLLCIAGDFTKYDEHAVQQINRNIELIRYQTFGDKLLLFELVNASTADPVSDGQYNGSGTPKAYKTFAEYLGQSPPALQQTFYALKEYLFTLGDDVHLRQLKYYVAFRRLGNFACVEVHPQTGEVVVWSGPQK
jgi:hypothetical protein